MSHHLDTPLAAHSGRLFIDDFYVFPSQDSTVFMMDVNSNITGVYAQPGFHPEARYEFKVHFDDAEYETLTYRVSFGEPNPGGRHSANVWHPGDVRLRRPQRPDTGRHAPEAMMSLVTGTAVPSGLQPSVSGQVRSSDFPNIVPV